MLFWNEHRSSVGIEGHACRANHTPAKKEGCGDENHAPLQTKKRGELKREEAPNVSDSTSCVSCRGASVDVRIGTRDEVVQVVLKGCVDRLCARANQVGGDLSIELGKASCAFDAQLFGPLALDLTQQVLQLVPDFLSLLEEARDVKTRGHRASCGD